MNPRLGQKDKQGNEIIKIGKVNFWVKCSRKFLKGLKLTVMNKDFILDVDGNWFLKLRIDTYGKDFK